MQTDLVEQCCQRKSDPGSSEELKNVPRITDLVSEREYLYKCGELTHWSTGGDKMPPFVRRGREEEHRGRFKDGGFKRQTASRSFNKDGKQRAEELFWWVPLTLKEHVTPSFFIRPWCETFVLFEWMRREIIASLRAWKVRKPSVLRLSCSPLILLTRFIMQMTAAEKWMWGGGLVAERLKFWLVLVSHFAVHSGRLLLSDSSELGFGFLGG